MPPRNEKNTFFVSHGFCFCERHNFAFIRGTTVPLGKGNKRVFFFCERHSFTSARGMVVLSREARLCLLKMEKRVFWIFFPSARGPVLLMREARLCFRVVPLGNQKNTFSVFFLPREPRFCFRERYGRDYFGKGKNHAPGFFHEFFCQDLSTWDLVLKIST